MLSRKKIQIEIVENIPNAILLPSALSETTLIEKTFPRSSHHVLRDALPALWSMKRSAWTNDSRLNLRAMAFGIVGLRYKCKSLMATS